MPVSRDCAEVEERLQDLARRAPIASPARAKVLAALSEAKRALGQSEEALRLMVEGLNHRSNIYRALVTNPGFAIAHDDQHVYARNLEVPSGGAVGTARGIAHAYGVFAAGGVRAWGLWGGEGGLRNRIWVVRIRTTAGSSRN